VGRIAFLIDSSVWLEILLEQDGHEAARALLERMAPGEAVMSEFSLYSIGIILTRHGRGEDYELFMEETVGSGSVERARLDLGALRKLSTVMEEEGLDFDDAYQYVAAERFDLEIVSFDDDVDRTSIARLAPEDALERLKE
jgi:predicted nucleic acid-binding protein